MGKLMARMKELKRDNEKEDRERGVKAKYSERERHREQVRKGTCTAGKRLGKEGKIHEEVKREMNEITNIKQGKMGRDISKRDIEVRRERGQQGEEKRERQIEKWCKTKRMEQKRERRQQRRGIETEIGVDQRK